MISFLWFVGFVFVACVVANFGARLTLWTLGDSGQHGAGVPSDFDDQV